MEGNLSLAKIIYKSLVGLPVKNKKRSWFNRIAPSLIAFNSIFPKKLQKNMRNSLLKIKVNELRDLSKRILKKNGEYFDENQIIDEIKIPDINVPTLPVVTEIGIDIITQNNDNKKSVGHEAVEKSFIPHYHVTPLIKNNHRLNFEQSLSFEFITTDTPVEIDALKYEISPKKEFFCAFSPDFLQVEDRYDWLMAHGNDVIDNILENSKDIKTLSFDVFDTFLLRGTESEAERFHLFSEFILQKLADDIDGDYYSAEALTIARAKAMQLSYRLRPFKKGCNEGSIYEVARSIAEYLGNRNLFSALIDLEIEFEAQMLRKNPIILDLLKKFKNNNRKIILISDMYLHANQIYKIIEKIDPETLDYIDQVYSSADTILNKRSGTLYDFVQNDFSLIGETTLHIGDSFRSDVEMARNAGWNALHFPIAEPEKLKRQHSLANIIEKYSNSNLDIQSWANV